MASKKIQIVGLDSIYTKTETDDNFVKKDKITGDVVISGNLDVTGTTTTKDTETVQVKDNIIVANSDGVELIGHAGFAIKTDATDAYGIMYDPVGDGVKIGLGSFDENGKFIYDEGEAQFLATRSDTLTDGNLPQWDNEKKQLVDSGAKIGELVKFTDYATESKTGVVKTSKAHGTSMDVGGLIKTEPALPATIELQANAHQPIVPKYISKAVKVGITTNTEEWTDEDKAKACETIGAVNKKYVDDGFVAKHTPTTKSTYWLYGVQCLADGRTVQGARQASATKRADCIPIYGVNGQLQVGEPAADYHATPKSYVDGLIAEKDTELAVINTVLEQSGLVKKYKQPITQEYNERVTADGLNVLDESKAVLKKVVGNTVACKNLIPYPYADTTKTENGVTFTDNGDGTITLNGTATARTTFLLQRNKTDIILRQGSYIVISAEGSTTKAYIYLDMYVDGLLMSVDGTAGGVVRKKQIQQNAVGMQLQLLVESGEIFNNLTIKPQIEYGDTATATEYQPYFTGLKSASFAGIESTNADGTETSTLDFPKTETPLGTTIDFETKKITNTHADYTFTGNEGWAKGSSAPSGMERWYCSIPNMAGGLSSTDYNYGVCDKYTTIFNIDQYYATKEEGVIFGFGSGNNYFHLVTNEGQTEQSVRELTKGMTVRFPFDNAYHTSTDFTATQSANGNEYTAYKGGTEKVLENDGNEYGADNTLTQDYILVTEVK